MILAGDIGGTNVRLAVCEPREGGFRLIAEAQFAAASFAGLNEIVENFLSGKSHKIERACFGVAGVVTGETVKLTNLSWTIDAPQIRNLLAVEQVYLINDLAANAYGLRELSENDFAVLNEGVKNPSGNAAIISAGTGLGEAGLFFDAAARNLRPFASEGGHADFSPGDDFEIELWRYLAAKFGRVSVERVVSGQGLINIYEFLRDAKHAEEPLWLAEEIAASDDAAAIISKIGIEEKAAIGVRALEIFVAALGAEAGNLALKMLATGGVFLGGGIAPKILPKLKTKAFLESFQAKGRMRELLEKIPVRVVLNNKTALLGAAHFAFYEAEKCV